MIACGLCAYVFIACLRDVHQSSWDSLMTGASSSIFSFRNLILDDADAYRVIL